MPLSVRGELAAVLFLPLSLPIDQRQDAIRTEIESPRLPATAGYRYGRAARIILNGISAAPLTADPPALVTSRSLARPVVTTGCVQPIISAPRLPS